MDCLCWVMVPQYIACMRNAHIPTNNGARINAIGCEYNTIINMTSHDYVVCDADFLIMAAYIYK